MYLNWVYNLYIEGREREKRELHLSVLYRYRKVLYRYRYRKVLCITYIFMNNSIYIYYLLFIYNVFCICMDTYEMFPMSIVFITFNLDLTTISFN